MKNFCPFLSTDHRQEQICDAGFNFSSVGRNRELCRACPLADLGDVSLCEHLTVYAFKERDVHVSQGKAVIIWKVHIQTECTHDTVGPAEPRCLGCPGLDRLENSAAAEAMMFNTAWPQGEPA
jgi:hypothetical protein